MRISPRISILRVHDGLTFQNLSAEQAPGDFGPGPAGDLRSRCDGWPLEVANALTGLVRRRKLTDDDRRIAVSQLRELLVTVDHEMAALAFATLSDLAAKHGLSVYDAAYLELAQRRKLVLGCKDGPLRDAARRCGVKGWTRR